MLDMISFMLFMILIKLKDSPKFNAASLKLCQVQKQTRIGMYNCYSCGLTTTYRHHVACGRNVKQNYQLTCLAN
jgi:hypothetical protein